MVRAGQVRLLGLNAKKALLALFCSVSSALVFFEVRRMLWRIVGFRVGRGTTIHRSISLFRFGGLSVGKHSTINCKCLLDTRGGLTIGSYVNISHNVRVYTATHDIASSDMRMQYKEVSIADYVWIFPNVQIMPGVSIGVGAVIFPGSVVTRDVAPYDIVAGVPATSVGQRRRDLDYDPAFPVWFGI